MKKIPKEWQGDRRVDYDLINNLHISTVRLSIDHGYNGTPLWYETMIFPADSDYLLEIYCDRYTTEEQAIAGHQVAIQWAKNYQHNDKESSDGLG